MTTLKKWKYEKNGTISNEKGHIAYLNAYQDKANAEFIVKACNVHYELLEACKNGLHILQEIYNKTGGVIKGETPLMVYDMCKMEEAIYKAEGKGV